MSDAWYDPCCVYLGTIHILKKLISLGADVNLTNSRNQTILFLAIWKGQAESIDLLLKAGALVDPGYAEVNLNGIHEAQDMTPLMLAASIGFLQGVKMLRAHGADINKKNRARKSALFYACQKKQADCMEELLMSGAKLTDLERNDIFTPPVITAVKEGRVNMLEHLLNQGASANLKDSNGDCALFIAAASNNIEIVKCMELLVQYDVYINMVHDSTGYSAAMIAVDNGNCKGLTVLLKAGIDINIATSRGITATFIALQKSSKNCLEELLKYKPNLNTTYKRSARSKPQTPIMVAVKTRHFWTAITLLLKHGAPPRMIYSCGLKSIMKRKFRPHMVTTLYAAGIKARYLPDIVNKSDISKRGQHLQKSTGIGDINDTGLLLTICRKCIRHYLLMRHNTNLFVIVPKLPLPNLLISFLLFDATL